MAILESSLSNLNKLSCLQIIQRVQLETELQEIMLEQAGSHLDEAESTEDLKIRKGGE